MELPKISKPWSEMTSDERYLTRMFFQSTLDQHMEVMEHDLNQFLIEKGTDLRVRVNASVVKVS